MGGIIQSSILRIIIDVDRELTAFILLFFIYKVESNIMNALVMKRLLILSKGRVTGPYNFK